MSPSKAERVRVLAEKLAEAARKHDEAAARAEGKTDIATWQDYLVARDARARAREAIIAECEAPDTEAT